MNAGDPGNPPLDHYIKELQSRRWEWLARLGEQEFGGMEQRGFGDLEAVVMERVWDHADPVTVRDIFDDLSNQRQIAYTTVMSTMDNLYRKRWLKRQRSGKAYVYRASMSREERSARLMKAAFDSGGDTNMVLSFFVDQMSEEQSAQLKAALRKGRR